MRVSHLIEALQKLLADHGDLDVETSDYSDARVPVMPPKIDWVYIQSRRELKPRFGSGYPADRRGRTQATALRALDYARSIGLSLHVYRLWSDGDEEQII